MLGHYKSIYIWIVCVCVCIVLLTASTCVFTHGVELPQLCESWSDHLDHPHCYICCQELDGQLCRLDICTQRVHMPNSTGHPKRRKKEKSIQTIYRNITFSFVIILLFKSTQDVSFFFSFRVYFCNYFMK